MKGFWQNVLATVVAAALVSNVAVLFSISNRLSRLEAMVENIKTERHLAQK